MIVSVAAALRLLGGWNAGMPLRHGLHAGQRGAARRERPQHEEDAQEAAGLGRLANLVVGALGRDAVAEADLHEGDERASRRRQHEAVRGDREGAPGLLDPAQVDRGQEDHAADRERDGMRRKGRDGARHGGHTGHHRDRDRQHVVDQQARGGDQRRVLAEVVAADRVGAAAVRIGVAGLPVRGDHDHSSSTTAAADPGGEVQERDPAEPKHEHDLLGGVRHRRERVGAEDRQGEPLRQQRVAEPVGAERPADEEARHGPGVRGHASVLVPRARGGRNPDAFLTPAGRNLDAPLTHERRHGRPAGGGRAVRDRGVLRPPASTHPG